MDERRYVIGEKTYIQRPIVLGQLRQLLNLLQGIVIPKDVNTMGLIAALGDKLSQAIAIILTPEGMKLKDKDIKKLATEIEFEISLERTIQVVEDFFGCNPIASLLEKLNTIIDKITERIQQTGSKNSSVSSVMETSPSETVSSGNTPLESAIPSSITESEK